MPSMKDLLGDTPYQYPQSPGYKEGTTSKDAARAIDADTLRAQVINRLRMSPATADEVARSLGRSELAVRPRLSELHKMGKIEHTGRRRANASGCMAHEWRLR